MLFKRCRIYLARLFRVGALFVWVVLTGHFWNAKDKSNFLERSTKMENHKRDNHSLVIEFNVDDMNPQHIPYLLERILEAGASDAFVTPVIMKKGRPGFLFTVTCCSSKEEKILEIIFSESTTIGVRKTKTEGVKLERKIYQVHSSFGEIFVKEITMPSGKKKTIPEYEECRKIAERENLPIKEVQEKLSQEINHEEKFLHISNN